MSIIFKNFTGYLSKCFEKVFAEVVMHGFHSDETHHKQTKVRADDFKEALESMGKMTFKIDLSFAYLFYEQITPKVSD